MAQYSVVIISDFIQCNLVKKIRHSGQLIFPMNLGDMSDYNIIFHTS